MKALQIIRHEPVFKHDPKVFEQFKDKKVWITGICGSIGWSLAKTLLQYGADVGGIDCNEFKISKILSYHKNLWGRVIPGFYMDIIPYEEDFVFHCAAFKHVRLAGFNPKGYERNNAEGVKFFSQFLFSGTRPKSVFVLCSTDKAAGESIMGKTKKGAEDSAVYYGHHSLRLVNVAYSKGSVLDVWRKTHKVCKGDISRYWMQMSDAVYALCLCALQPPGRYTVHNVPKFTMEEMRKAWDLEYGKKHWKVFEMYNEAQEENLISSSETMTPINNILAKIV